MAAWLGVLSALFLLAGACSDSSPSIKLTPGTPSEKPAPGVLPPPNEAIIVIRDVAGFFADCGCTGEITGGLARARTTALESQHVSWLFVGRLLMPKAGELTAPQLESYRRNLAAVVAATAALFKELKMVYWQPDLEELRFLEASNVDATALDQYILSGGRRLNLSGFDVEVNGAIRLPALSARCELPQEANRAKDVVVLSCWGAGTADTAVFRGDLGALVPLASSLTTAYEQAAAIIREASGPIITSWKVYLYARAAVDRDTESAVQRHELALMHQWSGTSTLPVKPIRTEVAQQWQACGSCHEAAVRQWTESRHAGAFDTLLERNRQRDGRCLACHTNAVTDKGTLSGDHWLLAVTCNSCHSTGKPLEACKGCHTAQTDPQGRYLHAIKEICRGGSDKSTGDCSRRSSHE